jgi:hypothetical protein
MQPEISLPSSQNITSYPRSEPDQSRSCFPILFSEKYVDTNFPSTSSKKAIELHGNQKHVIVIQLKKREKYLTLGIAKLDPL